MHPHISFTVSRKKIWRKWSLAVKIIPVILVVALLKYLFHRYNLEAMELNALFTSLVAGTIFLIGFLISGVLTDYKESEKIPGELASSLINLKDDTWTIDKSRNSAAAKKFSAFQKTFVNDMMDWFYKKIKTKALLEKITEMNEYLAALELEGVQPNYIIKLKNEQNFLRKTVIRIHTIRDTEFVGSAYAIVEAMGFLVVAGLLLIKIEPFYASLFFTLLVTFLIAYMFMLIKDLDNPFDYSIHGESGTEISLKPLHDVVAEFEG